MNEASIRQWAILKLLPRSPDMLSTGQILDRLGPQGIATSVRTVQRELNSLSISFPLVSDENKPLRWRSAWVFRAKPTVSFRHWVMPTPPAKAWPGVQIQPVTSH